MLHYNSTNPRSVYRRIIMLKNLIVSLVLCLFCFAGNASSFMPENNLYIPADEKTTYSISEDAFLKAIDEVEAVYVPIVKEKYGAHLFVERNWDDGTVNAYASQSGKEWKVAMFGGLARHEAVTPDGFTAVICHEVGHHIGGAPMYVGQGQWASDEGQSDYFANSKCLKMVFERQDEQNIYALESEKNPEEQLVMDKCATVFADDKNKALCFRSAMAGLSLATLLNDLGGGTTPVKFSTPSKSQVARTSHSHPAAQCRLDTYFAAALCDKDYSIMPDMKSVFTGYCTAKDGYKLGIRPRCWYQPTEYEK